MVPGGLTRRENRAGHLRATLASVGASISLAILSLEKCPNVCVMLCRPPGCTLSPGPTSTARLCKWLSSRAITDRALVCHSTGRRAHRARRAYFLFQVSKQPTLEITVTNSSFYK